jgi:hypothetical protein
MSIDHENINWMIRLGKIFSRLLVVVFVILLCIGLLTGNGFGTFIILFLPLLFTLLWSHSIEMSERMHNLEAEIYELKKMLVQDKRNDTGVANSRE